MGDADFLQGLSAGGIQLHHVGQLSTHVLHSFQVGVNSQNVVPVVDQSFGHATAKATETDDHKVTSLARIRGRLQSAGRHYRFGPGVSLQF